MSDPFQSSGSSGSVTNVQSLLPIQKDLLTKLAVSARSGVKRVTGPTIPGQEFAPLDPSQLEQQGFGLASQLTPAISSGFDLLGQTLGGFTPGQFDPSQFGAQFDPTQFGAQFDPSQFGAQFDPTQFGAQFDPTQFGQGQDFLGQAQGFLNEPGGFLGTATGALERGLQPVDTRSIINAFAPSEKRALRTFNERIVPDLLERFGATSGRSGPLNRAFAEAAGDLSLGLAEQRAPFIGQAALQAPGLQQSGAALAGNLAGIPLQQAALAGNLAQVPGQLGLQQGQLAQIPGQIGQQQGQLAQVPGQLGLQQGQLAQILGQLGLQQGQLAQVPGQLGLQQGQLAQIPGQLAAQGAQLGGLSTGLLSQLFGVGGLQRSFPEQQRIFDLQRFEAGAPERDPRLGFVGPAFTSAFNTAVQQGFSSPSLASQLAGPLATAGAAKIQFGCIKEGTIIDCKDSQRLVENIRAGDCVYDKDGSLSIVKWKLEFSDDPTDDKFIELIYENDTKIIISDMHKLDGNRAIDLKIGENGLVSKRFVPMNDRSYDLLTTGKDGSYRSNGIGIDSMVPDMYSALRKVG